MIPTVALVILNWNRKDDLLECLTSATRQDYARTEIVVVDNGSVDGSQEAVRDSFPEVTLLECETNLGFSRGNNVGIQYALEQGADYVFLLNNDTSVDERLLAELVQVAESDESIGAVGPKMYFYHARKRLWAAGGVVHFGVNVGSMRGWNQSDKGQYDTLAEVDYIPGCGILVKSSVIREVGLLDPDYFAYCEDADWCWRIKQRGYQLVYVPSGRMWHKVSVSSGGSYSPKAMYLMGYSSVLFVRRHAGPIQWAKFLVLTGLTFPGLLLVRGLQGRGGGALAKGRGIWDSLWGRELALKAG